MLSHTEHLLTLLLGKMKGCLWGELFSQREGSSHCRFCRFIHIFPKQV